jgi:hypothetical protein
LLCAAASPSPGRAKVTIVTSLERVDLEMSDGLEAGERRCSTNTQQRIADADEQSRRWKKFVKGDERKGEGRVSKRHNPGAACANSVDTVGAPPWPSEKTRNYKERINGREGGKKKSPMMNSGVGDGRGWPRDATREKWVVFFFW